MILITGATGNVGKALVGELTERGVRFRALARNDDSVGALERAGVEVARGDLSDRESLRPALEGVEQAFLLSPSSPAQVEMEGNFVEEAERAGVRRLVKQSALGVDEPTYSPLLRWHAEIEPRVLSSGVGHTFLRPTIFTQNLVPSYSGMIAQSKMIAQNMAGAPLSWVDVRDVAAVAATVLTEDGHEGRTYDITGPEAFTYVQLAEKISSLIGDEVAYQDVSDEDTAAALVGAGMPDWYAEALAGLFAFYRNGGGSVVTDTVERVTGRAPRTVDAYLSENAGAFSGK